MKKCNTYRPWHWLLGMLMAGCLLTACGGDDSNDIVIPVNPIDPTPDPDPKPETKGTTLQLGGVEWEGTRAATANTSIQLFLATLKDGAWDVMHGRVMSVGEDKWQSLLEVENTYTYYIYGYMPADGITRPTMTPINGDYSQGVQFTFSDLPAVTNEDICVLIGARKTSEGKAVKGYFTYEAESTNAVNLLFGHIYAALDIRIKVGADYDKLRTIKLRAMQLVSNIEKASLTIGLKNDGSALTEGSLSTSGTNSTADIIINNGEGMDLSTVAQDLAGFFAPCYPGTIKLVSTYNVYDKKGNLIRENCQAENKLPDLSNVTTGKRKVLTLTVEPTYLYMLSDPDLDSPTVTLK